MPILFNGSTGYLEHPAKIASGYPFSMMCWGTRTSSTGSQAWVGQSQSNGDRYATAAHAGSSDTKQALLKEPGASRGVNKTSAPHTSSTVLQLLVVVFTSTTSRTVYFGDNTAATDTASVANGITNHNIATIGARRYNSLATEFFANGSLAEAHYFDVALTATDVSNLIADTVKPEDISGWVDGWTLKDYEASGTYTSIGGTRTMTASGGVSASGLAHPISRASPIALNATAVSVSAVSAALTTEIVLTASATSVATATGNLQDNGLGSAAVSVSSATAILTTAINLLASGFSIASTTAALTTNPSGRFTTQNLKNNSGTVLSGETGVVVNVYNATTGALVVRKTGLTSDASGFVEVVDPLLVAGTSYAFEVVLTTLGRRLPTATAT